MKRFLGVAALLGLSGMVYAGPSSPPAGNYILNVSTLVAKPAIHIDSATIDTQVKLGYGTQGNLLWLNNSGVLTTTTTTPAGGDVFRASTQTLTGFNTFNSSTTFNRQVKVQTTGAGQGTGTGGSILVYATDETGMPFQIYTSSANQAGYFGLVNLIASNTNYANAMIYITGTSSSSSKADIYVSNPRPNIQLYQTGGASPYGQYEFVVVGDTLQFNAMNSGGSAQKSRLGMTHAGALAFYETSDNGHFVALKASATIASNVTWVLPLADGSVNQVLATDGAGNLSWVTQSGTGGGMSSGATYYVNVTSSLQSGATFYVSSGTVYGPLYADKFIPSSAVGGSSSGGYLGLENGTLGLIGNNADIYLDPGSKKRTILVQGSTLAFIASNGYEGFVASNTLTATKTIFVLPPGDGTNGQAIVTDGNKNLSFATVSGGGGSSLPLPGGATNYVQVTSSLQSGATFYVSSGTVNALTVGTSIALPTKSVALAALNDGTLQNTVVASSIAANSVYPLAVASGVYGNITGIGTQGQALNMNSNLVSGVANPVSGTDAANKQYVDTLSNGSTNYVKVTSALQSGATFYVSSGTVNSLYANYSIITTSSIWNAGNAMPVAIQIPSFVLLQNGYEMQIGGGNTAGTGQTGCAVFNPTTNIWSSTGALNTGRIFNASALMANSDVLTCGGRNAAGVQTATCEIFNHTTGVWASTTSYPAALSGIGLALLPSGDMVGFGGVNQTTVQYSSAAYILHAGVWSSTTSMPSTSAYPSVYAVPSGPYAGAVIDSGGDVNSTTVGSTSSYLLNGVWTVIPGFTGLSTSFNGANEAVDSTGLLYLIGGSGPPTGTYSKVGEKLDTQNLAAGWVQISSLTATVGTAWADVFPEPNNRIVVAGGNRNGFNAVSESWEYNPVSDSWLQLGSLSVAHGYEGMNLGGVQPVLLDGRFVSPGGVNNSNTAISNTDILTFSSSTLTKPFLVASTGTVNILGAGGVYVAYGAVLGSATVNNLTASQFVKTDASKNLASYDLFNDSPTWAGQQSWTSPKPSSFTYQVQAGSITGAGLATCGDSTHALGYASTTGLFSCQSVTGSGGGSGGYAVQPATVTFNLNFGVTATTVTVSSNTILPGTTFYQNGQAVINGVNSSSWLTGNQSITWTGSGDVTGTASGATSISPTLTLAASGVTASTYGSAAVVPVITVDSKGRVTAVSSATILASGGGASSLAVTTGSLSGVQVITSSPTAMIVFDSSTFNVTMTAAATAYVSINQTQLWTSTSTGVIEWDKPTGSKLIEVLICGAGGAGGGGSGLAAGGVRAGGGGGGGGFCSRSKFLASVLGSSVTVTVGAGSAGASGGSVTSGSDGSNGGNSTFETFAIAYGGGGGAGNGNGAGGGGGAGGMGAGAQATTTTGQVGGLCGVNGAAAGTGSAACNGAGGGTATTGGANGGVSFYSGAGGSGSSTTGISQVGTGGGSSVLSGAGGGAGGGVNAASPGTAISGTAGGSTGPDVTGIGGGGSIGNSALACGSGGEGGAGADGNSSQAGQGGGGAAGNNSTTGCAGGAGGTPSGGGGGGGGGTSVGGNGGKGGDGKVWIWSYF